MPSAKEILRQRLAQLTDEQKAVISQVLIDDVETVMSDVTMCKANVERALLEDEAKNRNKCMNCNYAAIRCISEWRKDWICYCEKSDKYFTHIDTHSIACKNFKPKR